MGMTMQHPRLWLLPLPQRIICAQLSRLPGQPEQEEVDTRVRVTLNTTLTKSQKRHPLPISSRGLPYSSSRPRECLHLEHYLF